MHRQRPVLFMYGGRMIGREWPDARREPHNEWQAAAGFGRVGAWCGSVQTKRVAILSASYLTKLYMK
jgi:hypothetical protein